MRASAKIKQNLSTKESKIKTLKIAKERFRQLDFFSVCGNRGLIKSKEDAYKVRIFGKEAVLDKTNFELIYPDTGHAVRPDDHSLLLHYLCSPSDYKPADELVTFREFKGGQFYWGPFQQKTTIPLVKRINNNIDKLQTNLKIFDWQSLEYGDFSAKIHIFGHVYIVLVYYLGDDEFPPNASLLFDKASLAVFDANDASVIGSRICLHLLV